MQSETRTGSRLGRSKIDWVPDSVRSLCTFIKSKSKKINRSVVCELSESLRVPSNPNTLRGKSVVGVAEKVVTHRINTPVSLAHFMDRK
jgi:hypothetical protein